MRKFLPNKITILGAIILILLLAYNNYENIKKNRNNPKEKQIIHLNND